MGRREHKRKMAAAVASRTGECIEKRIAGILDGLTGRLVDMCMKITAEDTAILSNQLKQARGELAMIKKERHIERTKLQEQRDGALAENTQLKRQVGDLLKQIDSLKEKAGIKK